ncbi:MAG: hypothetical protein ISS78_12560 [Phycisphaerae bacterium]|nr:hypothetical protein [Phycisphaerae bacterium]
MGKRTINYYLIKTVRLSGWILLPVMLLYIGTGFALCGKLGFSEALNVQKALAIHKIFDWPLVAVFLVHAIVAVYLAMRRWGWIGKRKKA